MGQHCPQCDRNFQLNNLRDIDDGAGLRMSNYPTRGIAKFCPYCGVGLESWDAYKGKEIIITRTEGEEIHAIIKSVSSNGDRLYCVSEATGQEYDIDSDYAFIA